MFNKLMVSFNTEVIYSDTLHFSKTWFMITWHTEARNHLGWNYAKTVYLCGRGTTNQQARHCRLLAPDPEALLSFLAHGFKLCRYYGCEEKFQNLSIGSVVMSGPSLQRALTSSSNKFWLTHVPLKSTAPMGTLWRSVPDNAVPCRGAWDRSSLASLYHISSISVVLYPTHQPLWKSGCISLPCGWGYMLLPVPSLAGSELIHLYRVQGSAVQTYPTCSRSVQRLA